DKRHSMDLLRGNKERVGFLARKKHALSSCNWEDLAIDIEPHLAGKNVHKLIFSRVHMGRRFGACSHLRDDEVKRAVIVRGPGHLANKKAFVPGRVLNPGDLLYALGVLSSSSIVPSCYDPLFGSSIQCAHAISPPQDKTLRLRTYSSSVPKLCGCA